MSQAGKDEQGKTKTNQDSYVMIDSIFNNPKINIFGVLDGHGSNGHLVSEYVKKAIIKYFSNKELYLTKKNRMITPELIYHKLTLRDNSVITSSLKT